MDGVPTDYYTDFLGRITRTICATASLDWLYTYAPTGDRMKKANLVTPFNSEHYLPSDGDTLCDFTTSGGSEVETGIYVSPGVDGRVARIDPTKGGGDPLRTTYFFGDALQSVLQVTDASGVEIRKQFTDAWGNDIAGVGSGSSGNAGDRYGFTGRENDAESGLMHYRARSYDPMVGRFTSRDPVPYSNLYIYVVNDPVNRVDPSGQIPRDMLLEYQDAREKALGALYRGTQEQFDEAYAAWGAQANKVLAWAKKRNTPWDIEDALRIHDEYSNTDVSRRGSLPSSTAIASQLKIVLEAKSHSSKIVENMEEGEKNLGNTQTVGVAAGSAAVAAPVAGSVAAGELAVATAQATQAAAVTVGVNIVNSELEANGVPPEYVQLAEAPVFLYGAGRPGMRVELRRVKVPDGFDIQPSRPGPPMTRESIDTLKQAMEQGTFDYSRGRVGGNEVQGGRYVVSEGHHRLTAAFELFSQGQTGPLTRLLAEGRWVGTYVSPVSKWPQISVGTTSPRAAAWWIPLPQREHK